MIDLKTCSYKGVEFLFKEASTPLGHRVVTYNYPSSDKQTVEIQGQIPKNFTIEAIIPHDEYYRKRDSLITVLEDKTAGTLQHPTFGRIDNVVSGECQLNESITELGRASISIAFYVDDAVGVPVNSTTLISQVQSQSDVFSSQIAFDIDDGFNVSPSSLGNFQDAFSKLGVIYDTFNSAIDSSRKIVSQAARFKQNLDVFRSSARGLIYNPINEILSLSGSIINLFDGVTSLFENPNDSYEAYKSIFTFENNDIDFPLDTFSRIERQQNRDVINTAIQSLALNYAYVEAASIDFELTTDLERVQTELEDQYIAIREANLISNEALEQLERVRVLALEKIDQGRVATRNIIEIETETIPLSVLVYQYYGNNDLFETITTLNNIKQNAFVSGTVKMLA